MVSTILLIVLVLAVGAQVTDRVRLKQQEAILAKLSTPDAAAFYRVLQRRVWKVRALRAVAVLSLVAILHARQRAQRASAVEDSRARATAPATAKP